MGKTGEDSKRDHLTIFDVTSYFLALLDITWYYLMLLEIAYLAGGGEWLWNYSNMVSGETPEGYVEKTGRQTVWVTISHYLTLLDITWYYLTLLDNTWHYFILRTWLGEEDDYRIMVHYLTDWMYDTIEFKSSTYIQYWRDILSTQYGAGWNCACDWEKTWRERECESISHYLILLDTTHLEIWLVLLNRPNINAIYGLRWNSVRDCRRRQGERERVREYLAWFDNIWHHLTYLKYHLQDGKDP